MLLYYITDRTQFAGGERERRRRLLERIALAASCGVDLVQLREKDLAARELAELAGAALQAIAANRGPQRAPARWGETHGSRTRLLVNSRLDVALAAGAAGVHLTSQDPGPAEVRHVVNLIDSGRRDFLVGTSCHSPADVSAAAREGATLAVLAPIFEKILRSEGAESGRLEGIGCRMLHEASVGNPALPVLALGGVNLANARQCLEAGAAGIAGIRLFQQGDLEKTVSRLRTL